MFTVITVTKNSAKTIERAVKSVLYQSNVLVEHIIKDAGSSDNTIDLARLINSNVKIVSCTDSGIYDAMNQGLSESSGNIIAFLNSDDYYSDPNVLIDVFNIFRNTNCDFVYGDITMVSLSGEIVRHWVVGEISNFCLDGKQIPHPSLFIKRNVFSRLKVAFDSSYKISADFKQQLIIIGKLKCTGKYLNRSLVIMQTGGESTNSLKSYFLGWRESVRAYNEVYGSGGLWFVIRKILSKLKGTRFKALLYHFGN